MEGFIRYASWGDPIATYDQQPAPGVKLASAKVFGEVKNFPQKYQGCIASYVEAMEKLAFEKDKFHKIGNYDPEFHYYRVISVHGDVPNDNGDHFSWGSLDDKNSPELLRFEPGLGKFVYQTFVGRGNFKNHKNDDVSLAVGINLDVCPNHEGKFIENLLAVDSRKDPELVRAIDKGYINGVSMGARVAYSICSICSHTAHNEDQYCDHIRHNKGGKIYHQGSFMPVFEDNRGVNFIELSWVTVPADRDALLLEKVASHTQSADMDEAVSTLLYVYGEAKTRKILNDLQNILNTRR